MANVPPPELVYDEAKKIPQLLRENAEQIDLRKNFYARPTMVSHMVTEWLERRRPLEDEIGICKQAQIRLKCLTKACTEEWDREETVITL